MDQEKRIMLAFAVSFAVLILWQALFVKTPPRPTKAPTPQAGVGRTPGQPGGLPGAAPPKGEAPASPGRTEALASLPVQQGAKAEEIVVESDMYRVTLSTQGAVVKSWELTKYHDQKGEPLDVVDQTACEQLGFPMSFSLSDASLATELNQAIYVAHFSSSPTPGGKRSSDAGNATEVTTTSPLKPPVTLTLVYSNGKAEARKQFVFGPEYSVHVEASVRDGQKLLPVGVKWSAGFGDHSLPPAVSAASSMAFYETPDGKFSHEVLMPSFFGRIFGAAPKFDMDVNGPLLSAGLEDRFFAEAFLAGSPDEGLHINRQTWTPPDFKGQEKDKPKPIEATLTSQSASPLIFGLAVAPKDLDVLNSFTPSLGGLINFGFFSFFAKPLFLSMRYIYEHLIHNYGWAIIVLTILINIAMFPLKVKGIRSAQRMQKVAPLAKGIQDRYKQYKFNDPRKQRMNQEMMELYKKHGVNPIGGCLPMGVQIPFLYGFYQVLYVSIELRHAAWIWWIKDLSTPDPYYIIPTLMVITMFALQKITPMATTDPAQKRMMMFMPLMMGILFYNLASGLNLYFLTANVVGFVQQEFINRKMPVPDLVAAPARKDKEEREKNK